MIGTDGERERERERQREKERKSGKSVLSARLNDDDDKVSKSRAHKTKI